MSTPLKCINWRIFFIGLSIVWMQSPARLNGMVLPLSQEAHKSSKKDSIPPEISFEAGRAGSDRYYVPGSGLRFNKILPWLGLAGSFEYFSELKKIEDLTIVTGLEFPSADDIRKEAIRPFLEPVQTRSALVQATILTSSWPRLRYTALIKDFDLTFKNEDRFRWRSHNFDALKGFPLMKSRYVLIVNPIFERRTITKKNDQTDEIENVFLLQFAITRPKGAEVIVQLSRSKVSAQDTDAETNNRFSRVEFRKLFPGLQSRLTAGWFHGRSEFLPGGDILTKDEIYLDGGTNLDGGTDSTSRLRDGLRLTWARIVDNRKSNLLEDPTARSLTIENKISYAVLPHSGWDFSVLQFYGNDFKEPSRYDFVGFALETEFYRLGLLRATLSFAIYRYHHLEQTERIFNVRLHPFRF
jgi:hypothetical protein